MRALFHRLILPIAFLTMVFSDALATHLRAGEITVTRVNCSGHTYRITVTVYIDTASGVIFGGAGENLHFGDSTWVQVPETPTTPRPDLGPEMGMASFTIEHTYSGPGKYLIHYSEPNRNDFVLNLFDPVNTRFFVESLLTIDPFIGCDSSPRLLVPPIDKACSGAAWFHNPGAFDPDGDSLSFELIVPKRAKGQVVIDYRDPNEREFYEKVAINFPTANEAGTGPPEFKIDPHSGTIVWDAPGAAGEYNIAFVIKEWRKVRGIWALLGYVVRDMQIVVEDCNNQRPELVVPNDICVIAGEVVNQDIFAFDPDSGPVKIEVFSQILGLNPSPATIDPAVAIYQPSSPASHARIVLRWPTHCLHVKEQPYQVVFKVTDRPGPGQGVPLVQFKTWNIRVVGPPPVWDDATVNFTSRSASLKWDPYACNNATLMQVWRRVDQFAFTPPECVTGMPAFLGFTKLTEVPISQTTYTDTNNGKGLSVGAQYCYRLVAVYPLPGGGESYVSRDTCLAPILADAPVITHVTVDKTSQTDGEITVRWRSPFDVNPLQFPPPYRYELYRAEGISGAIKLTKTHTGLLNDSPFTDKSLNTEERIYNYRVLVYDATNGTTPFDTSSVASSVRLETKSQLKRIELTWAADVPWNNKTQDYPHHLIYRGPAAATESQMELIASVDVNLSGYFYADEGQHNNEPLKETEVYCYRVMTRGAYGNPNIEEPLENFSQIICAQPNDDVPPCTPELSITGINCEDQMQNTSCGTNVFINTVTWSGPADAACRADIRSYTIYTSDKAGGPFNLYRENVRDTFFVDANENMKSFARCYQVQAVDRSGNKSPLSEPFCFDNCPYYELPNVFTPSGDKCNEFFSAFGDPERSGSCGGDDGSRCARFVEAVDFVVYNRWGKEVYKTDGSKEESIYIRWNGKDNDGRDLNTGVYFYKATVRFITVDPASAVREMKGWVHLVRSKSQ